MIYQKLIDETNQTILAIHFGFPYVIIEGAEGGLLGSWEWVFLLTGKLGMEFSFTGNWEF